MKNFLYFWSTIKKDQQVLKKITQWFYVIADFVGLPGVDKVDALRVKGVTFSLGHLIGLLVLHLCREGDTIQFNMWSKNSFASLKATIGLIAWRCTHIAGYGTVQFDLLNERRVTGQCVRSGHGVLVGFLVVVLIKRQRCQISLRGMPFTFTVY